MMDVRVDVCKQPLTVAIVTVNNLKSVVVKVMLLSLW